MKFVQDANINLYWMIVSPRNRPEYSIEYGVCKNVRFSTGGTNLVPEVGDVVTGDYGYKSQRGKVVAVREIGRGLPRNNYAFEVDLAEVGEEE